MRMSRRESSLVVEPIATLLRSAALAPSSHNTQPWRLRLAGPSIDLLADRTRALPVNDPDDRELTISCGCALMNLRVAAAQQGRAADVRLLPDAGDADWLAAVELVAGRVVEPLAALSPAIALRRTYRHRFEPSYVEDDVVRRLAAAAAAEGAELAVLQSDEARQAAAALVAEGDARQWADASWRRELAAWMHPRRLGDGLAVPALAAPVAQAVVRTFDMGGGVAARDRQLADESPLLAAVCTPHDTVRDWLVGGQALQRVLLDAQLCGLQASFLNQPIQVAALRPKMHGLLGGAGVPQILLRLGYPTGPLPATPRRSLDELLDE
jgi:hypothetical protein